MAAKITVPLDASGIEGLDPKQGIKVLVAEGDKPLASQTTTFEKGQRTEVTLGFEGSPRRVRVIVGPGDATDADLVGLQTITVDVPLRHWRGKDAVAIAPIRIPPYYWFWWRRWCRTFTIHGQLLCPNGQPVPGATVCAYDVDAWWWWWSLQSVGCAVTDVNGAFAITFRWCCGWWPWWWWRLRAWQLEPTLASELLKALQRDPRFPRPPIPDPRPDLDIFRALAHRPEDPLIVGRAAMTPGAQRLAPTPIGMTRAGMPRSDTAPRFDVAALDSLRENLVARLPAVPRLEALRLWPWWPWHPWWDCTPDIIFRATQPCHGAINTIVAETWFDARWNIPQALNVTLVANDLACCRPDVPPCEEGECLAFTDVCSFDVDDVGGNLGAPAAPVGYANPGVIAETGDAPFGDHVTIRGTIDCLSGVDYYEVEWQPEGGGPWLPMLPAALGTFFREYFDFATFTDVDVPFSAAVPISGHHVYETIEHYEATHTPADWGATKVWLATNFDVLLLWLTNGTFGDGAYRLRIVGWDEAGGVLQNPRVLPVCGTQTAAEVVVMLDNQSTYPPPGPADNPCGPGTTHACTNEPLTDILSVEIVHAGGGSAPLGPCGNIQLQPLDILRVDFAAYDAQGHLAWYDLIATYGENLASPLLGLPGATLTPLGGQPVPAALQVGPTYTQARLAGAPAPLWAGGAIRLEVSAAAAFPESCCYQLELRAYKRTVVNCHQNFAHRNLSERSFQVTV